ncbi:hypothetical protein APHAL10511_000141 [Amanita phalloides]|nr:hypothetical protein APHAL10511_000141 [Amanita phalloides]
MSGDQSLTAGSSIVTSSENIAADSNPSNTFTDAKHEIPDQATKIDELSKSLEEYGSTLAEVAVATSDSKFKEELTAIESWYQVLSRSERTTSIYTLLQHSDQDQKRFFIALLQQLLQAESNANENAEDNQLKTKPFARGLRPPSLNLPLPGSPATPRFTPATSRVESLPFIGASNTVNTPSFSMFTRTNENDNGSILNEGLNGPNVGMLNPQALNAVAGSGLSTEAQLLAIQLVMSGLVQPTQPQAIPKSARKHLNNWRAPPSAKYPGSALRHSALRSAGLKSAGLKSAVPDSAMEGVTPKEEDFNPEVLNDIPGWLRSLRLHKYTSCFEGMTWQEMVGLDDDGLEKKGITTLGARRRLLRTFEIVKKKKGMEEASESNATPAGEAEESAEAAMAKSSLSANSPVFIPRELRVAERGAGVVPKQYVFILNFIPLLIIPLLIPMTPLSQTAPDGAAWGSNFWVTLVDPHSQASFFACPATGQVSWDAPIGHFVLPPSDEGEWWELIDDSRGLPYYYHTKTGDTVWERPSGFVIPLKVIQNTTLGRRLSKTAATRVLHPSTSEKSSNQQALDTTSARKTYTTDEHGRLKPQSRQIRSIHSAEQKNAKTSPTQPPIRRSISTDQNMRTISRGGGRAHFIDSHLAPIPGSPCTTEKSRSPSPTSQKSLRSINTRKSSENVRERVDDRQNGKSNSLELNSRPRLKVTALVPHRPSQPQSLSAAMEKLTSSPSESDSSPMSPNNSSSRTTLSSSVPVDQLTSFSTDKSSSPSLIPPDTPGKSSFFPTLGGKHISAPIMNHAATLELSPVKNRASGKPIPVQSRTYAAPHNHGNMLSSATETYPALPEDLASDIQQFAESEYARQYFSTHRTGFIFRRKIPVNQLMAWQKNPLTAPLLVINRALTKDAVKIFKVIQHIMGDREREKTVNVRLQPDTHVSIIASINSSTVSLNGTNTFILDEERWLLNEGLTHGELRDEIYCQLMKQLTLNPSTECVFKGWQLLCVLLITFPPSKNFETHLRSFIQSHTNQQEGRVDIMAKYCLRRLTSICRKGPRGKAPSLSEIETASDAAFNPSTFGESIDAIIRLQERNYPHQKVPIILPFLADGILALGGPKAEGIFRVPGDGDSVSELKLRIDRGYYNLDGVDEPHVLASLMKLWLRELCDPLIPEELYNDCITMSEDADACVKIIQRLPTVNRRVVLFVISFLQLFVEDKVQSATKMTPANLALVMAPNLLRCSSESMSVVFTNAQFEQLFVYNLLLNLKCHEVDPHYVPQHGLAAIETQPPPRVSKSRARR